MEGWTTLPLAEVCDLKPPKREVRQKLPVDAQVSFVPMEQLGICQKSIQLNGTRSLADVYGGYTYFAEGDVLLAKITPCFENGKLGIATGLANGVGFGSSEFHVLRCGPSLLPEFLFYFLSQQSIRDNGARLMTGAVGHKRVPPEYVQGLNIPVPPLPEQKRIVAILDEAFEGIDKAIANTEKNLANATELFDARLEEIFEHRSPPWSRCVLKEICDRVSVGHVGPTSQHYCDREVGIAFLRSQNVRPGTLDMDDVRYVTPEFHNSLKKSQLRAGDLLFVRVGANRGDCCSVPDGLGELNCANIVLARPNKGCVRFLEYYCRSHSGRNQLLGMTTGSAQGVINTGAVAELSLPFPSESVQKATVEILDALFEQCRSLEIAFAHKLAELRTLKNALLSSAFSGCLGNDATSENREAAQ